MVASACNNESFTDDCGTTVCLLLRIIRRTCMCTKCSFLTFQVITFHNHCATKGQTFMAEWFLDYPCLLNWLFHNMRSSSQYCDYAMRWVIRGSNSGKDNRLFSSQNRADWLGGSPKFLSSGTTVHYRGKVNRRGVKLASHLHLVKGLRMSGVIPLLPLYAILAWTGTTLLFVLPADKRTKNDGWYLI
jgi:hypothetical protein